MALAPGKHIGFYVAVSAEDFPETEVKARKRVNSGSCDCQPIFPFAHTVKWTCVFWLFKLFNTISALDV